MNTELSNDFSIQFLGAAGTVTGSKTLIRANGKKFLVDCGLFQGLKHLRALNWQDLPVDASEIDAVILTHAHLDRSSNHSFLSFSVLKSVRLRVLLRIWKIIGEISLTTTRKCGI